jgi:ribosome biogenesis GTPase
VNFLSLWECDFEQVQYHYPDIYQIRRNCSFDDCVHLKEPGCAVKQAVDENELHPLRYESYSSAVEKLKDEQLHE